MASFASDAFRQAVLLTLCGRPQAATAFTTGAAGQQWIGLHSADPGIAGANAIASVARIPIQWPAAVTAPGAGVATITAQAVEFTGVAAGVSATHYGVYTAATGGAFLYGRPLSQTVTVPANNTGTIAVTVTHTYDLVS